MVSTLTARYDSAERFFLTNGGRLRCHPWCGLLMAQHEVRLRELGNFLRTRRARISPVEAGLVVAGRRRTPGLRREDIALLAGVSATWYTWLEQGRPVKASTQLLENLARILKLSAIERVQLFQLALQRLPMDAHPQGERISPAMRRLMDQIAAPAAIVGRRWDVLASNHAYSASIFDFNTVSGADRNLLRFFFVNPVSRSLGHWETNAREVLARFRVDFGRHAGDPDFAELVRELEEMSPEFSNWWPRQDVKALEEGIFEWNHPTAGQISADHITLVFAENPDLRLITVVPKANSASKIQLLTAQAHSAPRLPAVRRASRR